eukprot:7468724-Ditylum_brightwellii.AAC.1
MKPTSKVHKARSFNLREELKALQKDFGEYITSSCKMEKKLDAEINSLVRKLCKAYTANESLYSKFGSTLLQVKDLGSSLSKSQYQFKMENNLQ